LIERPEALVIGGDRRGRLARLAFRRTGGDRRVIDRRSLSNGISRRPRQCASGIAAAAPSAKSDRETARRQAGLYSSKAGRAS